MATPPRLLSMARPDSPVQVPPGTSWQHGGGTVVSVPCNMTGGSSGGPWFVQIGGNWYLNGHNDFTEQPPVRAYVLSLL